jgi:hypothetical protein
MSLELDIEAAPHQLDIVADTVSPTIAMEGGLGVGKTITAILKMLERASSFPGIDGLVVEPTNELVGTIWLPKVFRWLTTWKVPHRYCRMYRGLPSVLLLWPGEPWETRVWLRSGDRPERIVGFDVGWFIVDEADSMDGEVWARCVGRLRDRRVADLGGVLQKIAVYTPEPGFNWTWTRFHEKRAPGTRVIEGIPTSANPWNPKEYVEGLLASHDGGDRARVTEGRRSSRDGLVYARFDVDKNIGVCPSPWDGEVELWCDFNGAKMAWCWVSRWKGRAYIFDELIREDTDTDKQAKEAAAWAALQMSAHLMRMPTDHIRQMPPENWPVTPRGAAARVTVIGDAAGDHDAGAAGQVSYELIRQAGFNTRYGAKNNPFIEDTVQTVNMALADGWLIFDADRAPYTTKCIRLQPYGPDQKPLKGKGSREKVKAGLDHGADCIRYGTWFHRPVHVRRGNQAP